MFTSKIFSALQICLLLLFCVCAMSKSIQNESDIDTKDSSVSTRIDMLELSLNNISQTIIRMTKVYIADPSENNCYPGENCGSLSYNLKRIWKFFPNRSHVFTSYQNSFISRPLEKEEEMKRPIFFVRLSSSTTLQVWSIVKFDAIVIDEGGNFDSGDGIFIAPVNGVYMFSWTIQEYGGNQAYTELRVDNNVKGTLNIALSSSESYDAATRAVFCKVKKGDHVWIQTRGENPKNYFNSYYGSQSSFMGILVKQL